MGQKEAQHASGGMLDDGWELGRAHGLSPCCTCEMHEQAPTSLIRTDDRAPQEIVLKSSLLHVSMGQVWITQLAWVHNGNDAVCRIATPAWSMTM